MKVRCVGMRASSLSLSPWTRVVGVSVRVTILVVDYRDRSSFGSFRAIVRAADNMGEQREEAPKLQHWEGASRANLLSSIFSTRS